MALVVEYDGTEFKGFQYQTQDRSVQEELENSIKCLTGERTRVRAAGRTDAGVHAEGQVVAFDTKTTYPTETFVNALNYYLPRDVAISEAHWVHDEFDPRGDAVRRTYRYEISNRRARRPLDRYRACHVIERLDTNVMKVSGLKLVGRHDFALFCKAPDEPEKSTVRDLYSVELETLDDKVTITFKGSSFLRHQVRRMAGALVDVGRGKLTEEEFEILIDRGTTDAVANSLPACGLYLERVEYDCFPPKVGETNDN